MKQLAKIALVSLGIVGCQTPVSAQVVERRIWGKSGDGQVIELFTLKGRGGVTAEIANLGGRIISLKVPNKQGTSTEILLGPDDLAFYLRPGIYYGAIVGRYAGRISNGGRFTLEGKTYQLEKDSPDAKFVLHGGNSGFERKIWAASVPKSNEPTLVLTHTSPNGDGGFPGTLDVTVTYTITDANELRIDYRAKSDRPTIANFTNHSYFALQGEGNGDVSNQTLQVFADKFTPANVDNLMTGEILPVDGTPADFRKPVRIGDVLHADYPQIAMRDGLELNMIVNGPAGTLRPAARLSDPTTGIVLDISTTQPCLLVYSYNIGDGTRPGKDGKVYRARYAISPETEGFLDAPNHPNFPQAIVTPAKPMHEVTVFKFSK